MYTRQFAAKVAEICEYVRTHPDNGQGGLVVLDVDETVVSNVACVLGLRPRDAPAPPIAEMDPLRHVLRQTCTPFAFVTGRTNDLEDVTRADLSRAGWDGFVRLVMPAPESTQPIADFKRDARRDLATIHRLIATVGDQPTDLAGEPLGRPFLLPNPFYSVDPATGTDVAEGATQAREMNPGKNLLAPV